MPSDVRYPAGMSSALSADGDERRRIFATVTVHIILNL